MDIATITGMLACLFFVFLGIVSGPLKFAALKNFYDLVSIFITIGGSFCCVMMECKSIPDFLANVKSISLAMKLQVVNEKEVIENIMNLSNIARKEGLLALEDAAGNIEDDFLKKGVMLVVDGTDPELVRSIMETELSAIEGRHGERIAFWQNLAGMGPAWGMIGTLVGLVNMLKQLDDMAMIGPNMAIALLTTLYGSLIANWIAIPIATKLKANNGMEIMMKEVTVEGLLSIQAGENPRLIEEKLKSFLAPSVRNTMGEDDGDGAVEGGEA